MSSTAADTSLNKLQEYLTLARQLAHDAGRLILKAHQLEKTITTKSCVADCVTQTDKDCESLIVSGIQSHYPTHQFIAEESHTTEGVYHPTDEVTWIIDPVDGTNNFVHALPHVCVCIGVMIARTIYVGVVHNPILNETYHAIRGHGAYLNDKPIQTSKITEMTQACVGTEWGYDRTDVGIDEMLRKMRNLLKLHVQSVRMFGSCAMNMCSVACGRLDAYYEGKDTRVGPKPWDVAAAGLIVQESGGIWCDPNGGDSSLWTGRVFVASNSTLADTILEAIRPLDEHKENSQK